MKADAVSLQQAPLDLDGWVEFNTRKWGVKAERLLLTPRGKELPRLSGTLYLDSHGRIYRPPRNIYAPLRFDPTSTDSPSRLTRQWHEVAGQLVDYVMEHGLTGTMSMPPEVTDMRPWLWAGLEVDVRYTAVLALPFDLAIAESAVRNKIKKAERAGYRCEVTARLEDILECLGETEDRQGFDHRLDLEDLREARDLVGSENFRTYMCYAPDGAPASARIVLHSPGFNAVDLVAGTTRQHLRSGATQALIHFVLQDLHEVGADGLDFAGINIQSVAAAKEAWGARVTPYFTVREPRNSFRKAARERYMKRLRTVMGWTTRLRVR